MSIPYDPVSIHAPSRGATVMKMTVTYEMAVSIHAPSRGATGPSAPTTRRQNVSIHAPSRGATKVFDNECLLFGVSIHAPSRGATRRRYTYHHELAEFQSTHPHGVRQKENPWAFETEEFQSTHPHGVRQHRSLPTMSERCFNPRTLTGCDNKRSLAYVHGILFQSTHPHGVRLVLYGPATGIAWRFNPRTLTGCDGQNESQSKTSHCFNPRTLTGCDVAIKAGDNVIWNVSIHAPSRGATRVLVEKAHWEYVSIHAPSRGATIITPFLTISIPRFNPRTLTGCDKRYYVML